MNPTLRYQCSDCGMVHDTPDLAEGCCAPEVNEVYECCECGTDYSSKDEAEECCQDEQEESDE